jgi:hypothetical protein
MDNSPCTVLLEVTNACNLACRVLWDAKGDRQFLVDEITRTSGNLIKGKGFPGFGADINNGRRGPPFTQTSGGASTGCICRTVSARSICRQMAWSSRNQM